MQGLNKDDHFGKRVEYHVAHLLNHYVTKGMEWHDLPQAFQVSVLNFYFDKPEKEAISHYCLRNENGRTNVASWQSPKKPAAHLPLNVESIFKYVIMKVSFRFISK